MYFLKLNNERNHFYKHSFNFLKLRSLRNKCIFEIEIKSLVIY